MADQQEQYTYAELQTYRKVQRIIAETEADERQAKGEGSLIDSTEDPAQAWAQRQAKIAEERSRKPKYSPEEQKMMKDLAARF
jgi:hypothetical protein